MHYAVSWFGWYTEPAEHSLASSAGTATVTTADPQLSLSLSLCLSLVGVQCRTMWHLDMLSRSEERM
eukprot:2500413-Amphidinium_carterae.1